MEVSEHYVDAVDRLSERVSGLIGMLSRVDHPNTSFYSVMKLVIDPTAAIRVSIPTEAGGVLIAPDAGQDLSSLQVAGTTTIGFPAGSTQPVFVPLYPPVNDISIKNITSTVFSGTATVVDRRMALVFGSVYPYRTPVLNQDVTVTNEPSVIVANTPNVSVESYYASYSYTHLNAAATTTVKNAAGVLKAVVVNNPGSAMTVTVEDGTTDVAVISPSAVISLQFDIAFNTSLVVTLAGTTIGDVTIVWQ